MPDLSKGHEGPVWAKGYSVPELKAVTGMFKRHDEGMIHGAFGRYSETDLVADLEGGRVVLGPDVEGAPLWALVGRSLARRQGVKDFTGAARLRLDPGVGLISRVAWQGHGWGEGWEAVADVLAAAAGERPLAVELWQEHPGEQLLAERLLLELAAVKIAASSEMRGVWTTQGLSPGPYPPHQAVGLARLPVLVPSATLAAVIGELPQGEFAQHYSSYNKGESWTALSLRGFYDEPERIEKPAEMSSKWKREHEEDLAREVRDTRLRAQMPAVEEVLRLLPCEGLERVRLMVLAPGGGELERHADITDKAAGAEPGRIVRLHVPLLTNEECRFEGWDLNGTPRAGAMKRGGIYYLDTRKPHTAVNAGESPRVHLVADVIANEATVAALAEAAEFPRAHEEELAASG